MAEVPYTLNPKLDSKTANPIKLKYAIVSQQRSGSNWLCAALINREIGIPAEYLNPWHISKVIERSRKLPTKEFSIDDYISLIEQLRTSEDGIFGIKIQTDQLKRIAKNDMRLVIKLLSKYDRVIFLYRRNKLEQAASCAIAKNTKKWLNDGEVPEINKEDFEKLVPTMATELAKYISADKEMESISKSLQTPILNIYYEEMTKNHENCLIKVTSFLLGDSSRKKQLKNIVKMPSPSSSREIHASIIKNFLNYIQQN